MKKIVLIALVLFFTNQGNSQLESPVLEQACPRNVVLHINGVNHCMDTFPLYYPVQGDEGGLESLFMLHRSSIMKILGEEIWYNEKAEQDRIRILFIEYEPYYDSVRLYTFSDYHKDSIVLTRKMMLTYDYPGLWGEDDTVCYNTYKKRYNTANNKIDTIHYSTTRYFITGKEFRKLKKYLQKSKDCNTLPLYHYGFPPSYYIEYILNGEYHLHMIGDREYVKKKKYCAPILLKILNWFSRY